jgi:hypothetical protein
LLRRTLLNSSEMRFAIRESTSDKFGVDEQLRTSVLWGLAELGDSFELLGEEKTSYWSVESQLLYNVQTVYEEIDAGQLDWQACVNEQSLRW